MDHLSALKTGARPLTDEEAETSDRANLTAGHTNSSALISRPSSGAELAMKDFFADVDLVKTNIQFIKDGTNEILLLNQSVLKATSSDQEKECSRKLDPLVKRTNLKAASTKKLLQGMSEQIKAMRDALLNEGKSTTTPELRIRDNLVNTLTRKFVDVMKEYQSSQSKYKTDIKKKVKRQVQISNPNATNEEIDAIFKSNVASGDVFKNVILKGDASESITNALENAKDKFNDVLALEASVAELHQMFLDFALLTEQQGELLDQIEHQVKEASEYIEEANVDMVGAIEIQKSIRKKQCIILLIILIILGVIGGVVAAKVNGTF